MFMRLDLRLWCGAHAIYAHLLPTSAPASAAARAASPELRRRLGPTAAAGVRLWHSRHGARPAACRIKKNEPPWGGSGVNREASNGVDAIHSGPENWIAR